MPALGLLRLNSEEIREDLIAFRIKIDAALKKINEAQREEQTYIIDNFANSIKPILFTGGTQAEAIFQNIQDVYNSKSPNSTVLHKMITQKCAAFIHNLDSIYRDKSVS